MVYGLINQCSAFVFSFQFCSLCFLQCTSWNCLCKAWNTNLACLKFPEICGGKLNDQENVINNYENVIQK